MKDIKVNPLDKTNWYEGKLLSTHEVVGLVFYSKFKALIAQFQSGTRYFPPLRGY